MSKYTPQWLHDQIIAKGDADIERETNPTVVSYLKLCHAELAQTIRRGLIQDLSLKTTKATSLKVLRVAFVLGLINGTEFQDAYNAELRA